ncbi:hypothetical protein GGR56DRAFT_676327 [Xylariaceae sp. FL0804]|nr:hypothetical protein GGR56DRAFT_676327 [Xylariaceae sp. FL0804]
MAAATDSTRSAHLYFAYGSNLSTTQMRERCPHSAPLGLGHIAGWKWIINDRGYANIVVVAADAAAAAQPPAPTTTTTTSDPGPDPADDGVYGLIYRLDARDEAMLDACEGVPYAYERAALPATWASGVVEAGIGVEVMVLAYVDRRSITPAAPRGEYVGRMNRGIDEATGRWGLPRAYVDRVLRPFIPALERRQAR